MYHYSNYDSWRTENPWDGMARMAGFDDEEDMLRHEEEEDPESGHDFDELAQMGVKRLPKRLRNH